MSLCSLLFALPLLGAAPDTAVVCPAEFRETLAPWIALREKQGHKLAVLSNEGSADDIRGRVRDVAKQGKLKAVVLVGDSEPATDAKTRARSIPAHIVKAKVNIHWGSEPEIATDNWYADLDDDRLPDVAIGRLSADTPKQLEQIVAKILAYERDAAGGAWRTRVHFTAGVGGFGALTDAVLESAAQSIIVGGMPAAYTTTLTQASWRSPYFPDPRKFCDACCDRLSEGGLFWVYIGHGSRRSLDHVQTPAATGTRAAWHKILENADTANLKAKQGPPIAMFLACYTGAFDDRQDCLAEELLRSPGGPVGVISGSRMTMPYAMGVMGIEALDQVFQRRVPTVGEALLGAKRAMIAKDGKNQTRKSIEMVAKLLSPKQTSLEEERSEHLDLFNLIGDPLLRIRYPREIAITAGDKAQAGATVKVSGACPLDGKCTVELVTRRDRLRFSPTARSQYKADDEAFAQYTSDYARANDTRWTTIECQAAGGRFEVELKIPPEARGECFVRAFVNTADDFAAGAKGIVIEP